VILLEIVQNIALLIALAAVYQVIGARLSPHQLRHQLLSGLLFGIVGLIGMLTPMTLQPGLIFDGRSIILSVAGLFGGPVVAAIAAAMCGAYRLWLGGPGVYMGVTVIAQSAGLGVLFHYLWRRNGRRLGVLPLWGFGLLVHLLMLAAMALLPGSLGPTVLAEVGPTVLIAYPLATMLVCLLFIDSERRQALRTELAEAEARQRVLLEEAGDPIFSLTPGGRYRYVNRAFAAIVGRPREQIIGRTIAEVWSGEAARVRQAALREVVHSGVGKTFETIAPGPDGERTVLVTYRPVLDENRQVVSVIGTAKDVTDLRQMAAALERERRFLRQLIDLLPGLVCVVDLEGRYVLANEALARAYNVTVADLLGKTDADFSPTPEQVEGYFASDRQVIETCQTVVIPEDTIRYADGTTHFISSVKVPILDENGRCHQILVVSTDITERKEAEAERERLQAQLLQAQKMEAVGRLAGGVAHDFNNMLTAILGYAELALAETPPDSVMHRRLTEIQNAAQRSADLTRQLLGFARKQIASPRVLDLNDTVAGMLKMLRRLIGEDIEVAWLPGADVWPVKIDPAQVDQILANLCLNARDAIGGVGKVTIETGNVTFDADYCADHPGFLPGDYAMLAVSDDGRGMDAETLQHIFEPFFTTKAVGQGTGLGLATVYGIVKQNDGFINVYSEPGVGTIFKVYLPRAAESPRSPAPQPSPQQARGSETVLLVEDEPMLLEMGQAMLQQLGYTVLTAANPTEALRLAETYEGPIHLLMTDVVMPRMNGRELAARIKRLKPDIRTLFMSGYTANVIAHRGVLDEGVSFIQKPFSLQALAEKLRAALEEKP